MRCEFCGTLDERVHAFWCPSHPAFASELAKSQPTTADKDRHMFVHMTRISEKDVEEIKKCKPNPWLTDFRQK